ncbi:Non-specific serine/threonine protein kinase [Aphelenchoides fujianensis]|nr:Non-specific serine/threonine protein kinase [Aphelenchoides fujianensis]
MSPEQSRSIDNAENRENAGSYPPNANSELSDRNLQHTEANVLFRGHLKLWDDEEKKWTERFFVLFRDHSLLGWTEPPADFFSPLHVFTIESVEVTKTAEHGEEFAFRVCGLDSSERLFAAESSELRDEWATHLLQAGRSQPMQPLFIRCTNARQPADGSESEEQKENVPRPLEAKRPVVLRLQPVLPSVQNPFDNAEHRSEQQAEHHWAHSRYEHQLRCVQMFQAMQVRQQEEERRLAIKVRQPEFFPLPLPQVEVPENDEQPNEQPPDHFRIQYANFLQFLATIHSTTAVKRRRVLGQRNGEEPAVEPSVDPRVRAARRVPRSSAIGISEFGLNVLRQRELREAREGAPVDAPRRPPPPARRNRSPPASPLDWTIGIAAHRRPPANPMESEAENTPIVANRWANSAPTSGDEHSDSNPRSDVTEFP